MTYRVFTNDVGPNGFSCLDVIEAPNDLAAIKQAARLAGRFAPVKVIAIPDTLVSSLMTGGTDPGGMKVSPSTFQKYGSLVVKTNNGATR